MLLFFVCSSAFVLTLISFVHFYWLFGGRRGLNAVLPEKVEGGKSFSPRWIETLIVALGLLVVALILLIQYDLILFFQPNMFTKLFCIIFTFVFLMRAIGDFKHLGIFKKVKHTTFSKYDTRLYNPLCLYLALTFTFAWS
ncbi:DUF3995 domain-containing protein [Salipaludibacillus sp. HK11]|uniref:DUF3995 domain-containing protein n=1 Tax=Salipaludibacillus sp. HK11 TaxID=3394320 RepID=UPI0039FC0ABC